MSRKTGSAAAALTASIPWIASIWREKYFPWLSIMDGLSAGVGAVAALCLSGIALANGFPGTGYLGAALAGALWGFRHYNVEPARIYLGDTGSLFIGLNLGALAMIGRYTEHNGLGVLVPLVILGVPIFDTLFVMYIRRRRGVSMFLGSPDHVALRLRRWRLSVRQTVAASCVSTALLGAAGIAIVLLDARGALSVLGGLAVAALFLALWLKRIDMGL